MIFTCAAVEVTVHRENSHDNLSKTKKLLPGIVHVGEISTNHIEHLVKHFGAEMLLVEIFEIS